MISALLGLLAATPPIIIDDRTEFPWVVAAQAGHGCGSVRVAQSSRPIGHSELVTRLALAPRSASTETFASVIPLVPTPSLLGVEGAVLIGVAESIQRGLGRAGPVVVEVDADGARLRWQVPPGTQVVVDDDDIFFAVDRAAALLAEQDASVGHRGWRHSVSFSCFGQPASDAVPSLLLVRARFATRSRSP